MIEINAVNQYNLGTMNTDFKMFGIQTNFGISTAGMFYMQIMYNKLTDCVQSMTRSMEFPYFILKFQYSS